jgi:hypothetical protein
MSKLRTVTTPKNFRERFEQDDSGHWYAIPAKMRNKFNEWVVYMSDESEPYVPWEGEEFNQYRLGMHPSNYTFTDLKEDE